MMNERIQPLAIQQYIALARKPGVISFAAGLPDLSVLPLANLKAVYHEMEMDSSVFQYQQPSESLKEKIQMMMAKQSVECKTEEIIITNGAQQAIYLTANLFLKHHAPLMVQEFVYPGFLQVSNLFDLEYLPLSSHLKDDIDLDVLEFWLKTKNPLPYLYLVCNGHNPYGSTLKTETRQKLAYLAEKYKFILIEDDPYGYLSFTNEQYLPLRAYTRHSIYMGSFSKFIAPALRIGWVVGEQEIIQKLQQLKDSVDLNTLNPNHLVLNELLNRQSLSDIVYPQKTLYKKKLDYMISLIKKYLDVPVNFIIPQHGMFLWLEFPQHSIDKYAKEIFNESNVLYIPSAAFAIKGAKPKQAMRLNFSYPSFEDIELGIRSLCVAINHYCKYDLLKMA